MSELRVDMSEIRAVLSEVRTEVAGVRTEVAELRADMTTRLNTLFAALAEFRAEYQEHTHGES
ncbi:MAG: hypothetical protein M4D85_06080 [Actinomycetota bacterium]|nr:hypothetical protein [Actinomycetota bacterium]